MSRFVKFFLLSLTSGSNKKYVKISGTMVVISGNIKLINNSFILKYSDTSYAPFLFYNYNISPSNKKVQRNKNKYEISLLNKKLRR